MDIDLTLCRCSSLGDLVNDRPTITKIQLETLAKLQSRRDKTNDLTIKMQGDLDELIGKRDAPYNILSGGETVMHNMYLAQRWNRYEDGGSKGTRKGTKVEPESIRFVSLRDNTYYEKNDIRLYNNYITGIPDVRKIVPGSRRGKDVKSSQNIFTHKRMRKEGPNRKYIWQGKGYCFLDDLSDCEIVHVLTNSDLDDVRWEMFQKAKSEKFDGDPPAWFLLDILKNHVFDKKSFEQYSRDLNCFPDNELSEIEYNSFEEVPHEERWFSYYTECKKEDKELIIESVRKGREHLYELKRLNLL